MLKKIIVTTLALSSLMAIFPQKSYSYASCSTVAMQFHSNCLSWGLSSQVCSAEARNVFNNCIRYDQQNPLPVLAE